MTPDVHPRVLWTLATVFATLVLASVIVWGLKRARSRANLGEVADRVRSWWVMAVVFSIAIASTRTISLVFFAFVSFLALKEYLSLIPTRRADRRVLFWAYLAIPFQYYWVADTWYGMFIIWIPVYAFLAIPARMALMGQTEGYLRAAGTIHWGLMMTVFTLSHVAYLLILPGGDTSWGGGSALVLYLVILTELNDVAQYVWGKALGRHAAVPKVSPGKTLEGFAGGLVTTIALAWVLAPWLTPLDLRESIIAGILIGTSGFLGDIVLSAVKRDLRIKDSGSLLPGHGGALDRLDSLTFTAPLFFHFIRYMHF